MKNATIMKYKQTTDEAIAHNRFLTSSLLLVILMFALSGCKSNFPDEEFSVVAMQEHSSVFFLGPGDSIRLRVYEHPDLSGSFNVDDTGSISLPLILDTNVSGLTLRELEQKIAIELTNNFIVKPKVSIDLVQSRPFCILGEVRNPGCFSGLHGMNSAQAIAIAGGYTYRAYKEKIAITREGGKKVVATTQTPIFAGDLIEVFERYF
jgi:protein involved in polysaccharide export with SLBB domain